MAVKNNQCINKKAYPTKESADEFARDLVYRRLVKENQLAYLCTKCNMWHLSPESKSTPGKLCNSCTKASGRPKILYDSYESANKRKKILENNSKTKLKLLVYECPVNAYKYHLTSH